MRNLSPISSLRTVLLGLAIAGMLACDSGRTPRTHLIPDGYIGWVRIYFGVEGQPALPLEDGYLIVRFPESGVVRTSTRYEAGVSSNDQYFYESDEDPTPLLDTVRDRGGQIWNIGSALVRDTEIVRSYSGFFVGTEEQFLTVRPDYSITDMKRHGTPGHRDNLDPELLPYNLKVKQIADDTYIVTDTDYFWSNTLVAAMSDGTIVMASSPFENKGATTLLEWIHGELAPDRIVAINTHYHRDGTGGNHVYREYGVETWSSELTRELQGAETADIPDEDLEFFEPGEMRERIGATPVVHAEHVFDLEAGKTFTFGGETVEVIFPGHAHSPDNLVVWFPERGLLFGGCIVKPKDLGYLGAADVSNWSAVTRKLNELEPDVVVPGHGKHGGSDLLTKTIEVAERAAAEPQ